MPCTWSAGPSKPRTSSLSSRLNHSVSAVWQENELRGLERADAVISVPLAEFGPRGLRQSGQIMQRGYEAANSRARFARSFCP